MFHLLRLIPFYPLLQFLRSLLTYGWAGGSKRVLVIWFVKLILLEPFRLLGEWICLFLHKDRPKGAADPVFLLGYYRSGTSYLQELCLSLPNMKSPSLLQAILPEVGFAFEGILKWLFQSITRLFAARNEFQRKPLDWGFPGEEDVSINSHALFHDYNKVFQYPHLLGEFTDKYLRFTDAQLKEYWLNNHRYLTDKLHALYPNNRLLLKSPPNTGRLDALKECYPNARFVFIHRNPYEVIQSARRLLRFNRTYSFSAYSEEEALEFVLEQYKSFHQLFLEQCHHHEVIWVRYQDLLDNPLKELRRIFDGIGFPAAQWPLIWEAAQHSIRKAKQHLPLNHRLPSEVIQQIEKKLGDLIPALGYERIGGESPFKKSQKEGFQERKA